MRLLLVLILILSANQNTAHNAESLYPATMVVTEVNRQNNTVTIETATGFMYAFTGTEDWDVGDVCSCIMSDEGTPDDIEDDSIISCRYTSFTVNQQERR